MEKSQKSQENTLSHIISPKYYYQETVEKLEIGQNMYLHLNIIIIF